MKIIKTVTEMHKYANMCKRDNYKIAFVPTMGYLHEGHLSLVKKARELAEIVVVSIFVNPTQFAANEDLSKYPRDIESDFDLLNELKVDAVFYPDENEIYSNHYQTFITVEEVSKNLEGAIRPTHFKGVATVVGLLFNCIKPDFAVFGQKDAQQVTVIKRMVNDLKLDIQIIVSPTIRESNGLAMSSRNIYLNTQEKIEALSLSKSLNIASNLIESGEVQVNYIVSKMMEQFAGIESAQLDYIAIVEVNTFQEISTIEKNKNYFILVACKIGTTRLIDNLLISNI